MSGDLQWLPCQPTEEAVKKGNRAFRLKLGTEDEILARVSRQKKSRGYYAWVVTFANGRTFSTDTVEDAAFYAVCNVFSAAARAPALPDVTRTPAPVPSDDLSEMAREAMTAEIMSAAIKAGFDPRNVRKDITVKQVFDACAIVITFMREAQARAPARSFPEWIEDIENLMVPLSGFGDKP